ncbi:hypothetical protein QWZ08_02070 [Ferruginibacter paludis]|nr:hypothetical protein [Ferruginibacter paludis]
MEIERRRGFNASLELLLIFLPDDHGLKMRLYRWKSITLLQERVASFTLLHTGEDFKW